MAYDVDLQTNDTEILAVVTIILET